MARMRNPILLVFPPYEREAFSEFEPIGISCIASYIVDKNPDLDVRLIDFTVEKFSPERWRQELEDFKPEIVGISMVTLNYPGGKLLAQLARHFDPTVLIVMGGPHASAEVDACLEHCDIVVRGEGEITFDEIIQGNELDAIKGISYRRDGEVVHNEARERIKYLDALPFPAHHLFKMEKYSGFPRWGIMGSRGCPYNCIFCGSPQMWGRMVSLRSPSNIVDEIEHLHDRFGVQGIQFFDDTINIPQERAIEISDEIIKRNLHKKMSFAGMVRVNRPLVSPELFASLKQANFTTVSMGIESGSERVLKSMGKSLTLDEARRAIKMARSAGIKEVMGFFMVGNWDETIGDVFRTWRFVLSNNIQPAFSICMPLPGTSFNNLVRKQGYLPNNPDWASFNQSSVICRTNAMSKPTIFVVYAFSVIMQFIVSPIRGGRPGHTLSKIVAHAFDKLKLTRQRSAEL